MMHFAQPQLCLVTDSLMLSQPDRIERALDAGITLLQIRAHHLTAAQLYPIALSLRARCQRYSVPCLVNDRLDVGLAAHVDGFQLGSRSLPLSVARTLVGQHYLLGASVHTLEEAQQAVIDSADFLLAGTIFASSSHPGETTQGPAFIADIQRCCAPCPIIAIGGINNTNAEQVMQAGAHGIAVISAISQASDIAKAVKELRKAIGLG